MPARPCPPRAPPGLPEVRGTDLGMAAQPLWVSVPRGWSCPSPWPRRSCGGAGPQQRPWTVASGGFCLEDPGAPPLTVAHVIRGVSRSPGVAQLPHGPLGCPPVRWLPPVTVPVAGWEADAQRGASQHALGSADRLAGQPCLRGTRQEAEVTAGLCPLSGSSFVSLSSGIRSLSARLRPGGRWTVGALCWDQDRAWPGHPALGRSLGLWAPPNFSLSRAQVALCHQPPAVTSSPPPVPGERPGGTSHSVTEPACPNPPLASGSRSEPAAQRLEG